MIKVDQVILSSGRRHENNLISFIMISLYIDDPGERIAKLRGSIRIYTESPLQTQWRRVKPGDAKTMSYVLINWPFSLVTGVRYFHIRLWKIALLFSRIMSGISRHNIEWVYNIKCEWRFKQAITVTILELPLYLVTFYNQLDD